MTTIERSAAGEMVSAGEGQIAELEAQITDLQRQIDQAHNELAYGAQSRKQQEAQLDQAGIQTRQLEEEYDKIHSYALLASGTANEKRALSQCGAAKRAYETAHKALAKLSAQVEEAEHTANELEQELQRNIRQWQTERQTRQAELVAVRRGMSRATSELGQETFDQAQTRYHEMAARICAMKKALLAEQIAMQEQFIQALDALEPWSDLQKEVRHLEPPDDSTWRVIEGTLQYMDLLSANITTANIGDWPSPWDMRHVLFIPEQELYSPNMQDERRRRLEQVKEAYLAHWQTVS